MSHTARGAALALIMSLLVAGFGGWSPAQAVEAKPEVHPEWGQTFADNGVLRRSCRNYRYSYKITPPKGDWALETFLIGPGGTPLSSGAMAIGTDPANGHDKFRICRPSTRPGVFRIRALLSVQDSSGKDYVSGWLPVTKFRLRARR
jgi:hypothetical protein